MAIITVENISKTFENETIIKDVSIELNEGEIVSLLGVSGSGKTTLFNIISGIEKPDGGRIILDGENVTEKPGKISYMLQKDMLFPYKTVLDNVALPLIIKGEKKKTAKEKARVYFRDFGLEGTQKKYPAQLSGGMRQRAAFLRTYLFSEKVALLDEPFSALDMLTKQALHEWYLDVMGKINLSVLFVTHDVDEAIMLSDRIYIMTGKPGEITGEIVIDKSKNERNNFNLTEEFLEYKKEIFKLLQ